MSSPELRQRAVASKDEITAKLPSAAKIEEKSGFSFIEIGRIVVALVLLVGGLSWVITGDSVIFNWRQLPTLVGSAKRYFNGPLSLTDAELARYDGTNPSLPIYVGLNGTIYDVSSAVSTYGPGGSYAFFAGKDATRAFVTGCFQEDLTPDLRGVELMHIPVDPEDEVVTKGQLKIRKERDMRLAKKQVKASIAQWEEVFSGSTGRPYFKAGTIKREEDWLEKTTPRELCKAAQEGRTKRADVVEEAAKKPAGRPGTK